MLRARSVFGRFAGVAVSRAGLERRTTAEILASLERGKSAPHRQVETVRELRHVFRNLTREGTRVDGSYPGIQFRLQDGTLIGLRETSHSGGATIDIFRPGQRHVKVHIR